MESLALCNLQTTPLPLSRSHIFSSKPISFISFLSASSSPKLSLCLSSKPPPSPLSPLPKSLKCLQNPFSSFFKPITITITLSLAILFSRFQKPSFAAPLPPSAIESLDDSLPEKENTLQEYLESHPDDVSCLKALMEVKVKLQKFPEAIDLLDHLILLQPQQKDWALFRAHLFLHSKDILRAKSLFEDIISTDPFHLQAYQGVLMATSQSDPHRLEDLSERLKKVVERCKKERKEDLRDFKLLVAQLRVTQGKYEEALSLYKELVKDEPRDFRPYLCQGIIYTLLRKMGEAKKQFDKYRRLVPRGHPYAQYFDENVFTAKGFSRV